METLRALVDSISTKMEDLQRKVQTPTQPQPSFPPVPQSPLVASSSPITQPQPANQFPSNQAMSYQQQMTNTSFHSPQMQQLQMQQMMQMQPQPQPQQLPLQSPQPIPQSPHIPQYSTGFPQYPPVQTKSNIIFLIM